MQEKDIIFLICLVTGSLMIIFPKFFVNFGIMQQKYIGIKAKATKYAFTWERICGVLIIIGGLINYVTWP